MATQLDNGVRSLQIKFNSGSMTISKIKEGATTAQLQAFANAIGLFTNYIVTGIVVNDKEAIDISST